MKIKTLIVLIIISGVMLQNAYAADTNVLQNEEVASTQDLYKDKRTQELRAGLAMERVGRKAKLENYDKKIAAVQDKNREEIAKDTTWRARKRQGKVK